MKNTETAPVNNIPDWAECNVQGYTIACDPGRNTITPYPKHYTPDQIKKGMNLTAHCEYLPPVIVREVGKNFLTLQYGGTVKSIFTGGHIQTPRKPLEYAYSEVDIYLK